MSTLYGRMDEGRDCETYKAELLLPQVRRSITGYLKLTEDARKVIAELCAAQVGRALGLPIPTPYIALLDTADLREQFNSRFANRGLMVCFASRQASARSYSLERGLNQAAAQHALNIGRLDTAATVAFDEFVANTDRNLGNIVFTPEDQRFWLIDHGRALTGHYWATWGLGDPAVSVENTLADRNSLAWPATERVRVIDSAHEFVTRASSLCFEAIDEEGHYEKIDPRTDKREIIAFLRERVEHTVPLLCQRLQIGHLPFQPRPPSSTGPNGNR